MAKYNHNESLGRNAIRGVDITEPETGIDKTTLFDLIYDRLTNNTDNEMFEPEMANSIELVYDSNTHEAEYITININDKNYNITITEE